MTKIDRTEKEIREAVAGRLITAVPDSITVDRVIAGLREVGLEFKPEPVPEPEVIFEQPDDQHFFPHRLLANGKWQRKGDSLDNNWNYIEGPSKILVELSNRLLEERAAKEGWVRDVIDKWYGQMPEYISFEDREELIQEISGACPKPVEVTAENVIWEFRKALARMGTHLVFPGAHLRCIELAITEACEKLGLPREDD